MSICRAGVLGLRISSPLFLLTSEDATREPIRLAPLPMEASKTLRKQFSAIANSLQQAIDRPLAMVDYDDYLHLGLQILTVSLRFPEFGLFASRRQLQRWGDSLRSGALAASDYDDTEQPGSLGELPPLSLGVV